MEHFDIIIIGTGAGGGTILHKLKDSGKKILVLERGTFMPQEKENWQTDEIFRKERYHTTEVWKTKGNKDLHPGINYWVGGNTKVFGAALFRLRENDFKKVQHAGGTSHEWPLSYSDMEPYYTAAEKLYHVHGKMGVDPTEAYRSSEYPYPAVSHEPRIQELHDDLEKKGLHPFHLPIGIHLNESDAIRSKCIRCNTCDGYPCMLHAKSDADITCVRPATGNENVTLLTDAKVIKLNTNSSGSEITSADVEIGTQLHQFSADLFILSAGAINSAALLLKSVNSAHPKGLANKSDQVGRNYMKHNAVAMVGVSTKPNPTVFQKTLAVNDFYFGDEEFKFPMGHIQLLGKSNKGQLSGDAPFFTPGFILGEIVTHSIDWWMTGEDLADPENRVTVVNDQIHLDYKDNNMEGFKRMIKKLKKILYSIDSKHSIIPHSFYLIKKIELAAVGHQCGTARFGTDEKITVLDINCKAHEIENLYVVDGSFFPSSGAVNPALTIIANALRVGDHLLNVMK
jgi:choline dehydrogenase-like flavoprotein